MYLVLGDAMDWSLDNKDISIHRCIHSWGWGNCRIEKGTQGSQRNRQRIYDKSLDQAWNSSWKCCYAKSENHKTRHSRNQFRKFIGCGFKAG